MIVFECDCGRIITTYDENSGRRAKCPECGDVVQVPPPSEALLVLHSSKPQVSKQTMPSKSSIHKVRKAKSSDSDEFDDLPVAEYDDDPPPYRGGRKNAGSAVSRGNNGDAMSSKKKKQEVANGEGGSKEWMLVAGCIFGGGVFLAIGIGAVVWLKSPPQTASATATEAPAAADTTKPASPAPAAGVASKALPELEKFSTDQAELTCLAPKGWEKTSGGGSGGVPVFATFESGKIKIQFRSSPSGTQIGAIVQAGSGDPKDLPESMRPVSRTHEYQKLKFESEVAGYKEIGEPVMFKCAGFGGEGRISAFTSSDGMFGRAYGFRATLIGTNHQWNVVCKCPPGDWKTYQPLFLKVLESAAGN